MGKWENGKMGKWEILAGAGQPAMELPDSDRLQGSPMVCSLGVKHGNARGIAWKRSG